MVWRDSVSHVWDGLGPGESVIKQTGAAEHPGLHDCSAGISHHPFT